MNIGKGGLLDELLSDEFKNVEIQSVVGQPQGLQGHIVTENNNNSSINIQGVQLCSEFNGRTECNSVNVCSPVKNVDCFCHNLQGQHEEYIQLIGGHDKQVHIPVNSSQMNQNSNLNQNTCMHANNTNLTYPSGASDRRLRLIMQEMDYMKRMPHNGVNTVIKDKAIGITNWVFHNENGYASTIVYICQSDHDSIWGFYLWDYNQLLGRYGLHKLQKLPEGYIEIAYTVISDIVCCRNTKHELNPKVIYEDYCKDIFTRQCYNCSYTSYLQLIIDRLCDSNCKVLSTHDRDDLELDVPEYVCTLAADDDVTNINTNNITLQEPENNSLGKVVTPSQGKMYDFNDNSRDIGFLPQMPTDFEFIGPDRSPILIDTVDKYIDIANIILDTGVPNYRFKHRSLGKIFTGLSQ